MKTQTPESDNEKLSALLRQSRPAPELPPGFQNAVWRRIERAQPATSAASAADWLDRVAGWILQPRLALAGATVLLLVGVGVGLVQGSQLAKDLAKQQYIAAVSPATAP